MLSTVLKSDTELYEDIYQCCVE